MRARVRSATLALQSWHLWLAAVVTFALYVGGARDYLLILSGDTAYIRTRFEPGGVAYFTDYPHALRALWTANIASGLIAPILLVARSRWSVLVAAICAGAQAVLLVLTFAFLGRWEALGAATSWFDIGIGVITALFAGYCWAMRRRNILS